MVRGTNSWVNQIDPWCASRYVHKANPAVLLCARTYCVGLAIVHRNKQCTGGKSPIKKEGLQSKKLLENFQGDFFWIFYVRYSTLLHLPPLRFRCVGGCRDLSQDCCAFGIDSQTL
jgi:hypothetical protein